jgi:hypothetical protein
MTQLNVEMLYKHITSLENLIKIQIKLFPEGIDEEFCQDVYLELLDKADQDAVALRNIIEALLQ